MLESDVEVVDDCLLGQGLQVHQVGHSNNLQHRSMLTRSLQQVARSSLNPTTITYIQITAALKGALMCE